MKIENLVDNITLCKNTLKRSKIFHSVVFDKDYTKLKEYKLDNLKLFLKRL